MTQAKELSQKELGILIERITVACSSPELNGWELEFLSKIRDNLNTYGVKTRLTDNQRNRISQTFIKAAVPHPDEPDYLEKVSRILLSS